MFGGPAREPESEITQKEMDIAASIQVVTEEIVLSLRVRSRASLGKRVSVWPGVALNCVANGRLLREGRLTTSNRHRAMPRRTWRRPCDAYEYLGNHRALSEQDPMRALIWAPVFRMTPLLPR